MPASQSHILASLLHICFISFTCSIHCLPQCSPQCFPWLMSCMLASLSHMLTSLKYCQCVKFCLIHLHKTVLCLHLDQSFLNQGFHSSPEIHHHLHSIYLYIFLQEVTTFKGCACEMPVCNDTSVIKLTSCSEDRDLTWKDPLLLGGV